MGAGAAVAARAILAPPVVAQEAVEGTLIHVCRAGRGSRVRLCSRVAHPATLPPAGRLTGTLPASGVCLIAQVADTSVAAPQVLTHAIGTDIGVKGALVDVCSGRRVSAAAPAHRGLQKPGTPGPKLLRRPCLISLETRVSQHCGHWGKTVLCCGESCITVALASTHKMPGAPSAIFL